MKTSCICVWTMEDGVRYVHMTCLFPTCRLCSRTTERKKTFTTNIYTTQHANKSPIKRASPLFTRSAEKPSSPTKRATPKQPPPQSHLNPQVPGDYIVRAPRLHLPVGGDGVHGQGREGGGGLGDEDDEHREQDAGLPHDEGEADEEDDAQDVLDAGLEDTLHRAQLALRGLLPAVAAVTCPE